MCEKAVEDKLEALEYVPEYFKPEKMCKEARCRGPYALRDIPDHLKTQNMCEKTVEEDLCSLHFVPGWFVTQQQIDIWHDDDYYCDDDGAYRVVQRLPKGQGPESKNKRRTFTHCLESIKVLGLVHVRR